MFSRLMNVIKSMLNKGISKVETPEILAEQAQMELEGTQKQLKEALISSITAEKSLEQKLQKDLQEAQTWQKRAELAVSKGDDDLAKQCLAKRQELEAGLNLAKSQLDAQKGTTKALKDKNAEHDSKVRDFQIKKREVIARAHASEAQAKANEILNSTGGAGSGLDKLEEKIRQTELRNEAINEMRGGGDKLLEDKLKALDKEGDLDMELLALKQKVADGGGGGPKLIEVKEQPMKMLPPPKEDAVVVEEVQDD